MNIKLGLALGGGGARGLSHIGVLKVLEREGIPISLITGTSIGAIVGGLYAQLGDVKAVEELSLQIVRSPIFSKMGFSFFDETGVKKTEGFWEDLLSLVKLRLSLFKLANKTAFFDHEVVEELFAEVKDAHIEVLTKPFAAIATDLISGDEYVFYSGSFKKALKASSAIPGIFPPVSHDNKLLVDGSVIDNIPSSVARKMGADVVIAVDVSRDIKNIGQLSNAFYIIYRADEINSFALTQLRLKDADLILRPAVKRSSWANFKQIRYLIRQGEIAAETALPQIEALLKKGPLFKFRNWIKRWRGY